MSNTTRYFFGAYLEIETVAVEKVESHRLCANGHKNPVATFCPKCGKQLVMREVLVMRQPTTVYELLGDDDVEHLASITPPSLYGKKIIAVANTTSAGHWLLVGNACQDKEILDFPTDAEVASLKTALMKTYEAVIAKLLQHPAVLSVMVRAGYVLDQEY